MKRVLILATLIGYLFLAPYCFAGNILTPINQTATHTHMDMRELIDDCGIMLHTTDHGNNLDMLSQHAGMYLSLVGLNQQIPHVEIVFALVWTFLIISLILHSQHRRVPPYSPATQRYRMRQLRYEAIEQLRHWISLHSMSPTFA